MNDKHTRQKLRVQTVFLMIKPWGSKQCRICKIRIKALISKVCISLV